MSSNKLSPGDSVRKINSGEWNRHVDASEFVHMNLLRGQGPGPRRSQRDKSVVDVRNDSGANRREGEILEFTGLVTTDLTDGVLWLKGGAVTLANGFGVLLTAIPTADPDNWGKAQVAGACKALVNVTDANHKFAAVSSGNYVLQSADVGSIQVLFKPSGTGEKECVVVLGAAAAPTIYRGITNSQINKGTTNQTVSRYKAGTNTDTGTDDTVTNDVASVGSGKIVSYIQLGSVFYILQTEKTSQTTLTNFRMKSGNTQIEAEDLDIFVDSVDTLAYSDKISVSSCP